MKVKQSLAVLSLLLATTTAVQMHAHKGHKKHHHKHPKNHEKVSLEAEVGAQEGVSANEFADAAVQARIEADADIEQAQKNHDKIEADAHNKAWKKHFKESQFYTNYAQHNAEKHECHGKCESNKKALAKMKFDYEKLQNKFEALEAKSVENSQKFISLQQQFKMNDSENVQLEESSDDDDVPEVATLQIQIQGEPAIPTKVVKDKHGLPHVDEKGNYNPGAASMDPNAKVWQRKAIHDGKVHGEKQHQENANDLQSYGDKQETAANTRLPYHSTAQKNAKAPATPVALPGKKSLIQLGDDASDIPSKVEKVKGLPHVDDKGLYNPGAAKMDPNDKVWQRKNIHDGKVHGEKPWQAWAGDLMDYGINSEKMANTRLPYASDGMGARKPAHKIGYAYFPETLLQIQDDVGDDDEEDEQTLAEKNAPETFAMNPVPVNASLLQSKDEQDGRTQLIETMQGSPSDVPLNFGFVHLQNQDGDDIMRYM